MRACVLRLLCVSALFRFSRCCLTCLKPDHTLCANPSYSEIRACEKRVKQIFDQNETVLEAGRVSRRSYKRLEAIMEQAIEDLGTRDFDQWEQSLRRVADQFVAAASKLPRDSGCVPPCGFQDGAVLYNCTDCGYKSCGFPLDCPYDERNATEFGESSMSCSVGFQLPDVVEVVWSFARNVKTRQLEEFEEVTAGVDRVYSIPSVRMHHRGTYLCQINTNQSSIVIIRVYFYLSVIPQPPVGHKKLRDMFEMSLLAGESPPRDEDPDLQLPTALLVVCLTSMLLLLFLCMVLYWSIATDSSLPEGDEDMD